MAFFDLFPKTLYDIDARRLSNYHTVTNIFFRMQFIRKALSEATAYYDYLVKDDETPEILAEKIYRNPEAHWIILLANDIVDPQYDWVLNTTAFQNYIIGKYGSVAEAQTQIHHYEKVIERTESLTGIKTITRFEINQDKLTETASDVPYDYYTGLPETQTYNTHDMSNGRTVEEIIYREAISAYDWEDAQNEAKRAIKIVKPEYYPQLQREFQTLTGAINQPYIRKLI